MFEKLMARSGWCLSSTRAFIKEAGETPGYSRYDLLHGYVYARWPYLYIGIGTGEHWLARVIGPIVRFIRRILPKSEPAPEEPVFADTYHGKVLTTGAARRLVTVNEDVRLQNLDQVVPYKLARDIILKNPDHIVALECPCRAARSEPCTPLDVCLIVGEPFASFVIEHHPRRSRWISPEQATVILEQEHSRGHVHHAFFKDAMFGRFYAICNCCPCCCGAMNAYQNGTPMLAASGYVSRVDLDGCIGCDACADACPFGAIESGEGRAKVDEGRCMGCGICVSVCDQRAISLEPDPARGVPLEIHRLMEKVQKVADVVEYL